MFEMSSQTQVLEIVLRDDMIRSSVTSCTSRVVRMWRLIVLFLWRCRVRHSSVDPPSRTLLDCNPVAATQLRRADLVYHAASLRYMMTGLHVHDNRKRKPMFPINFSMP
jgi:hypothetical protein